MVGYRYFSDREFRQASPPCSFSDMNASFMDKLDMAREFAGVPFIVNSAYRSVEYEIAKGRSGTSSHTKGFAVDIYCTDGQVRSRIIYGVLKAGIRRIGISKTFLHLDDDPNKPASIWLY